MLYLGLTLFMSERPIVAFLSLTGMPALVLPLLEVGRAQGMVGDRFTFYPYSDEEGYAAAFARAAEALALDGKRCAVEHLHMRVLELRALERVAPAAKFVSLEDHLPGLRACKDEREVAAMRRAIAITEQALHNLVAKPLMGMTERQIASRLGREMMDAGADEVAFIIVVGGPNSADPHAEPSDRPVREGDFLTIDCGLRKDGYLSDITRTFVLGEASASMVAIYEAVLRANAAGRSAIRAGVAAQDVDRAARRAIIDAGYGERFIHRTGHGLGIEVHEPPYIVEGNEQRLEPGMTFTVEPGIYVPGLGGVRIEDNVVVTDQDVDCLTSFPRELMEIG
jgi:Xaa-Pro dipeptidase